MLQINNDKIFKGLDHRHKVEENRNFIKYDIKEEEDDSLMTKEEFFNMIDMAKKEAREGNVYRMKPNQTVREFLDELCTL